MLKANYLELLGWRQAPCLWRQSHSAMQTDKLLTNPCWLRQLHTVVNMHAFVDTSRTCSTTNIWSAQINMKLRQPKQLLGIITMFTYVYVIWFGVCIFDEKLASCQLLHRSFQVLNKLCIPTRQPPPPQTPLDPNPPPRVHLSHCPPTQHTRSSLASNLEILQGYGLLTAH